MTKTNDRSVIRSILSIIVLDDNFSLVDISQVKMFCASIKKYFYKMQYKKWRKQLSPIQNKFEKTKAKQENEKVIRQQKHTYYIDSFLKTKKKDNAE